MVDAGITELGVIVGDTASRARGRTRRRLAVRRDDHVHPQDEPLGPRPLCLIAREFLGDDDFVMYLGDNLLEQDLAAFVDAFAEARAPTDRRPRRSC